jgi:hypothetical protein
MGLTDAALFGGAAARRAAPDRGDQTRISWARVVPPAPRRAERSIFHLFKFRSMRIDEETGRPCWATIHDPRITRIGHFIRVSRIDGLPQLFNVLLAVKGSDNHELVFHCKATALGFPCSSSPRRSGALATPERFIWLQTSSSGFTSGA